MVLKASIVLRSFYCLALLTVVAPVGLASASWVAISMGRAGGGGVLGLLLQLAFAGFALYRVVHVARSPDALDAPITSTWQLIVRRVGILLFVLGALFGVVNWSSVLWAHMLPRDRDSIGIARFVVGLWLGAATSNTLPGLLVFEFSRLLGFEQKARES